MSAKEYAIQKHWGQMYGDKPYLFHLEEVASKIRKINPAHYQSRLVEIAYLHDILEDTDVTYEQLKMCFGVDVASAVYALTNSSVPIREKLLCNRDAMNVKLIDRYCNVYNCIQDGKMNLLTKYINQADIFEMLDFKEPFLGVYLELDYMLRKRKAR